MKKRSCANAVQECFLTFIMKGEPFFRQFGVSSALRSKALAQGRFIRPEQVQSPKGKRPKGTNPAKEPRPMGRGSFAGGR